MILGFKTLGLSICAFATQISYDARLYTYLFTETSKLYKSYFILRLNLFQPLY